MDPAHGVRGVNQAPRRPQGVPVHRLRPQVLGQLGGEASVHKVDLAGFERGVDIGIHVNENTKTSQGVQQEHMLVFTLTEGRVPLHTAAVGEQSRRC